jgi:hypothetical protein
MRWLVIAILALLGILAAQRMIYFVASFAGSFCPSSKDLVPVKTATQRDGFQTDAFCWPTGLELEKGGKYRVSLQTPGDWFDKSYRADVIGFPSSRNWIFMVSTPLRRWWSANWFTPIARVGAASNDEYALEPSVPPAPFVYPDQHAEGAKFAEQIKKEEKPVENPISDALAAALQNDAPTPKDRLRVSTVIEPSQSGELFLFVNDAVLMWPGKADFFYLNNRGTGKLTVERLE